MNPKMTHEENGHQSKGHDRAPLFDTFVCPPEGFLRLNDAGLLLLKRQKTLKLL
jgi:hypothetical protein